MEAFPSATIDSTAVLVFLTAISAVGIVIGLSGGAAKKKRSTRESQSLSRWRVFRVCPAPLHAGGAASRSVVAEEPQGTRLVARSFPGKRWEIEADPHVKRAKKRPARYDARAEHMKMEIRCRGFLSSRFHAAVGGRECLRVRKLDSKHSTPEIRTADPARAFKLTGRPLERDYEIRDGDRLVAMVTSAPLTRADEETDHYTLELLRCEDPRPLIALVLCLEAAMPEAGSEA